MSLTIALLSVVTLYASATVLPAEEQHLIQSALNLVVERNQDLEDGPVLVSCATREISPTGGVPLRRDDLWQDLLERNATAVVLTPKLPANWRSFDDAEFRGSEGGLDWKRLMGSNPDTKAVVRLSRPGVSPDGLHAVVQAEVLLPSGFRGWYVYWLDRSRDTWVKVDHRAAWAPVGYSFPYDGRWELADRARAN